MNSAKDSTKTNRSQTAKIVRKALSKPAFPLPYKKAAVYIVLLLALVAIGNFFQNATFGTALIIVYGIAALVLRIRSDESFKMAIVTLLYVIVLTLMHNQLLAESFAQYTFLLLAIGAVSILFERHREKRKPPTKP